MSCNTRYTVLLVALAMAAGCDKLPDAGNLDDDTLASELSGPVDMLADSGIVDTGAPSPDIGLGDTAPDADVDEFAPLVVSMAPSDQAVDVDPDVAVEIKFSETMRTDVGTIELSTGELFRAADGDGAWSEDDSLLTVTPSEPLPGGESIRAHVLPDFEDVAGNPLFRSAVSEFTTVDDSLPSVVSTLPVDGAVLDYAFDLTIAITFDRVMDQNTGSLLLVGTGDVDDTSWVGTTLTASLTGLAPSESYSVILQGYRDAFGRALDPTALTDGALNFSLSSDLQAPSIISTIPAEGAVDVNLFPGAVAVVHASEPMDPTVDQVEIRHGTTTEMVTLTYPDGELSALIPLPASLPQGTAVSIDLTSLRDPAGLVVESGPPLIDGRLDFTTGDDQSAPQLVVASPPDGTTVSPAFSDLRLFFSEAMTPAATLDLDISGVLSSEPVVWSAGDTVATIGVSVSPGDTLSLDLTPLRDVAGNSLALTLSGVDDGTLDFDVTPASGERCGEELTVSSATPLSNGVQWELPAQSILVADGVVNCDSGVALNDAVIRYEKTSADLAAGGKLLRITVSGGSRDRSLHVTSGACAPSPMTSLSCRGTDSTVTGYEDVGPGTYWIHVVDTSPSGNWAATTVSIEELDAWPDGESCAAPFDAASANYTAPLVAGDPHLWAIASGDALSLDIARSSGGAGSISCHSEVGLDLHGVDAVVEYEKTSASSVVFVDILNSSPASAIDIEILSACDATDAATLSAACVAEQVNPSLSFTGAAGSYYIWLGAEAPTTSLPTLQVSVREVEPALGEHCFNALNASAGSNPVLATTTAGYQPASCMGGGAIEWYRIDNALEIVNVQSDGNGPIALWGPESGRELGCSTDASAEGLARFAENGSICVAVEVGTNVSSFAVTELAWPGVTGVPAPIGLSDVSDAFGSAVDLTRDRWLSSDADALYLGVDNTGIVEIDKTNGVATHHGPQDSLSLSMLGWDGVVANGDLFTLEDSTSVDTRVHRVYDGSTGLWAPEDWDGPVSWATRDVRAMTYDGSELIVADHYSAGTVFHSLSPGMSGPPTLLGSNSHLDDVIAIAADQNYLYLAARVAFQDGIFRLPRATLGDSMTMPERIAFDVDLNTATSSKSPVFVDDSLIANVLYFRAREPAGVNAIVDPGGAAIHLGAIANLGGPGDYAMTYDRNEPALYLFETSTGTGEVWRLGQ